MHEVHLMQQVVKVIEEALQERRDAKPTVVRLRVSSLSHLAGHDQSTVQSAFELASIGTRLQGARLEIATVPVQNQCRSCGLTSKGTPLVNRCEACGSGDIAFDDVPEMLVHEVVVTE